MIANPAGRLADLRSRKSQKVKRSKGQKSHLTKGKKWKWKSESEKVNEVNGELGESVGFANVIFQRTEMRRILNII